MIRSRLVLISWLALLGGCSSSSASTTVQPLPPAGEAWLSLAQLTEAKIDVALVAEREIAMQVKALGKVAFEDSRLQHVFSPVTGRVVKINAQLGQRVKKGDPLVTIESPDIGEASADLDKANAELVVAQRELARQKELVEANAGVRRDLEAAEAEYRKAKAETERARKKMWLLQQGGIDTITQTFVLRARIDGEVIARNVHPGMEVQGQYGGGDSTELFTIGEADVVWVYADVFEMDIGRVQVGAPVRIKAVAHPDKVFEGKVEWVAQALDPATRTVKVRCTLSNAERLLLPEMHATVEIEADARKVLALPRAAILRMGEQSVVFVEAGEAPNGGKRFERRPVVVEEADGDGWAPVKRGISAGERAVVSGAILLAGST